MSKKVCSPSLVSQIKTNKDEIESVLAELEEQAVNRKNDFLEAQRQLFNFPDRKDFEQVVKDALLDEKTYLESAYNQVQERASAMEEELEKRFLSYPIPKAIVEEWEKVSKVKN